MKEILEKIEAFMRNYENCNLYSIYEQDGVKQIKFLCYFYENDEGWQLIEFCWGNVTLEYFISEEFNIDDFESSLKQYQTYVGDVVQAYNCLTHYWCGEINNYNIIDMDNISMDTPCGLYLGW